MTFWILSFIVEMLEVKGTLYFRIHLWKKERESIGTDTDFWRIV